MNRCAFILLTTALLLANAGRAVEPVPPLINTSATTTLDSGGRPWAYLVFGENRPGLLNGRTFGIYVKPGTADAAASFVFRGLVNATTDPSVISVQLSRAASVGDNLPALETQLIGLHQMLINNVDSNTPPTVDPPALPLNQRLAAILNRANGDTSLMDMLRLIGVSHPAMALARGTAWAGALNVAVGAPVTLEIRERTSGGTDGAVIGRVTLLAGQPTQMPAPGPLAIVPDATAGGDLNIKLRWATSQALQQAGTRHHGDVLWHVSRAFAEAQGFNTTPPAGALLDALAISNPLNVKRVSGPIFPAKLFAAADVADFVADATTSFFADNNDRYAAGGVAMAEGAQVYYFVAAVDALGWPSSPLSAGVLGTFCKRVPPRVPSRLAVGNVWTKATDQYFDVSFQTNAITDVTNATRYEIFRGDDLAEQAAAQRGELDLNANPIDPAHPTGIVRIAIVPDPGAVVPQTLHIADDGGGIANVGTTWWFALRAVHQGPPGCGDVASALGPPVFGALRDRSAPAAPDPADIAPPMVDCLRISCINDAAPANTVSADPLDTSVVQFTAQCARRPGIANQNGATPPGTARNHSIIAAHFHVMDGATEIVPETVVVFPEDEDTVQYSWTLPIESLSHSLTVQCSAEAPTGYIAESPTGYMSAPATSSGAGVDPTGNHYVLYHFLAGAISQSDLDTGGYGNDPLFGSIAPEPVPWPSDLHLVFSPETGRTFHPQFSFPFPAGAEQYRVYRRIEDGPLSLIGQGLRNGAAILKCEDKAPSVWNGRVHYFAQLLDANGRASVMRKLGSLRFTGDKPPTPVLLTPKPADFGGTLAAPTVTLSWICPPEHVDRFEVYFKTVKPSTGMGSGSGISAITNFTRRVATMPSVHKVTNKIDRTARIIARVDESFLTGKVGGNFGAGPQFSVTMNLDPNLQYTVWLRALGPGGEQGDSSRSIDFQWQAPAAPPANIAWPARPLPPVGVFNPGIAAVDFRSVDPDRLIWEYGDGVPYYSVFSDQTPVGIRVGSISVSQSATYYIDNDGSVTLGLNSLQTGGSKGDPNTQLYNHATDLTQALLPCVLYRQQVANAAFPNVSGDVIQASPLISKIAWRVNALDGKYRETQLVDPFFRWLGSGPDLHNPAPTVELYLVDTQPVITGAAYRYWLMRFNSLGEPIQTVPCGEVTIAAAP